MRTGDIGFTSGSNKTTWWYVDLGGLKSVGNIRIQFKDYGVEYSKLLYHHYEMKIRSRISITFIEISIKVYE